MLKPALGAAISDLRKKQAEHQPRRNTVNFKQGVFAGNR
jgi:hypothetical protein